MRIFPKSVCKRRAVYRGRKSARKSHLSNQIRHWQTQFQLLQHDDDLLDLKLLSLHGQSPHLSWEESAGTPPQNLTTSVVSAPPRWRTVTAYEFVFTGRVPCAGGFVRIIRASRTKRRNGRSKYMKIAIAMRRATTGLTTEPSNFPGIRRRTHSRIGPWAR